MGMPRRVGDSSYSDRSWAQQSSASANAAETLKVSLNARIEAE